MRASRLTGCRSMALHALAVAAAAAPPDPRPNPGSVVLAGNARITVLTARLLRLEWSDGAAFEDRETLSFAHRNLPRPAFNVTRDASGLAVETAFLHLFYAYPYGPFSASNLLVDVHATGARWRPGMAAGGGRNLLGTVESLDGVTGGVDLDCSNVTGCIGHDQENPTTGDSPECRCAEITVDIESRRGGHSTSARWTSDGGHFLPHRYCAFAPIGRDGWAVYDDLDGKGQSGRAVIDGSSGWINTSGRRPANGSQWDTYFFGHGLEYKAALADLARVSGPPGRVPREVLGTWWSRYWPCAEIISPEIISPRSRLT